MDVVALQIRDQVLIQHAVRYAYTESVRTASWSPPVEMTQAIVASTWEPREGSTPKEAFGAITKAVSRLMVFLKRAPRAIPKLVQALAIEGWDSMSWLERTSVLGSKLKELMKEGKRILGVALKKVASSFPLSLFFVDRGKMPGLTDLMNRLMDRVPWLKAALQKVNAGAIKVDQLFQKYIPRLRRPLYAAVFIWVWLNVAELSWDIQGILLGFTGQISLSELLASLPESGLGFIAASFGLGYGALPVTLVARFIWLVAQHYLTYVPGKGFQVHWDKLGVDQRPELVPA